VQHGGYASVEKALKTMTPDDVVEEVKKSGLKWSWWCRFPNWNEMEFLGKARRC
jgi:NADH-quinone oxidoreductase subunit F